MKVSTRCIGTPFHSRESLDPSPLQCATARFGFLPSMGRDVAAILPPVAVRSVAAWCGSLFAFVDGHSRY